VINKRGGFTSLSYLHAKMMIKVPNDGHMWGLNHEREGGDFRSYKIMPLAKCYYFFFNELIVLVSLN